MKGVGVEQDTQKAMEWYKKAADQGHPHAGYNLAIGHLKGMHLHTDDEYDQIWMWIFLSK